MIYIYISHYIYKYLIIYVYHYINIYKYHYIYICIYIYNISYYIYTLKTFVYLLLHHFSQSSQPKGCHPRPQSGQKLKINGNRARDGRISSRRWLENQWDSHGRSMSDLLADWQNGLSTIEHCPWIPMIPLNIAPFIYHIMVFLFHWFYDKIWF